MKHKVLFLGLFLLGLSACSPLPEVINHEAPSLSVDFSPFEDAGCPLNQYNYGECAQDSLLYSLGCDSILKPTDLLGGLTPSLPIALCYFHPIDHDLNEDFDAVYAYEEEGYVYEYGGMTPVYVRYVVFSDGEFEIIKTVEDMKTRFAPIDSPEEALSLTLALDDVDAYYGLEAVKGIRYLVDTLEDSHVDQLDDGYLVHLFYYQFYGCGPHTTTALEFKVTYDGDVTLEKQTSVFEDPQEDTLCVD